MVIPCAKVSSTGPVNQIPAHAGGMGFLNRSQLVLGVKQWLASRKVMWIMLIIVNWNYPLVMTNSSPWFFDGPNRNRWFT
jgi:hypothetical protein